MKFLIFSIFTPLFLYASQITVDILGSGGPELQSAASSSYLISIDKKAKYLIDFGSGSMKNFAKVNARIEDLDALFVTHTHIDHINDLSSFVKAGFFTDRTKALPIYGPKGSNLMPSIEEYLQRLFGKNGVYYYMNDVLTSHSDSFTLVAKILPENFFDTKIGKEKFVRSVSVDHGIIPALAFRFQIGKKVIVFSGDTTAKSSNLLHLAKNADIFVAHLAIGEYGYDGAAKLHMRPSKIAQIAQDAKVKHLILSHLMRRSLETMDENLKIIKQIYKGKITIAHDLLSLEL